MAFAQFSYILSLSSEKEQIKDLHRSESEVFVFFNHSYTFPISVKNFGTKSHVLKILSAESSAGKLEGFKACRYVAHIRNWMLVF